MARYHGVFLIGQALTSPFCNSQAVVFPYNWAGSPPSGHMRNKGHPSCLRWRAGRGHVVRSRRGCDDKMSALPGKN